ncbi:MAG: lytic transglycosylase domain-containing protein [Pseudomonadota bacterium]
MRGFIEIKARIACVCLAALCTGAPLLAELRVENPAPPGGFTFKKIAPPPPGTTKRITIQIAPRPDPASPPPPAGAAPDVLPEELPYQRAFWEATGTDLAGAGPARFLDAAEFVARPDTDGPAAPSLSALQALASKHGRTILAETIGTKVSPALVLSVMVTESSGRSTVVSSAGAQGLMQLIPATAARFDVDDPFDPAQNIAGGVRYLDWLIDTFNGDAILALAGYNAGENAVKGAGGVPAYPETRAYVPKVLAAWQVARSLCATPPDLASDGCVFTTMAAN